MSPALSEKNRFPFNRTALAMGVTLALGQIAAPAMVSAQGQERLVLEEVIVTAQKREQSLQEVPISIRAIGGEELKAMGADDFSGYANSVPAVHFQDRGPGRNKLVIRGISPAVGTSAATVGVYIDDMPVADQLSNPDLKMFDVERIEILRGPQGTLYGEGSMGGTIRIITNKADPTDFYGTMEATGMSVEHGGTGLGLNGMLNIPLIEDTLALRLIAYTRDNDGWIDNISATNGSDEVNDEDTVGYRGSIEWFASSNLNVTLMAMHQDTDSGGQNADGGFNTVLDDTSPTGVGLQESDVSDLEIDQPVDEKIKDEYDRYNLTLEYDLSFATLTSVSSYFDRDRSQTVNLQEIAAGRGILQLDTKVKATTKTFTQEIRLVSADDGPLEWTTGIFYKDSERKETQFENSDSGFDFFAYLESGLQEIIPVDTQMVVDTKVDIDQYAVFADVTYHFNETWAASVGARYFKEDQDAKASLAGELIFGASLIGFSDPRLAGLGASIPITGVVPDGSFDTDDDTVNPRFNVSYTPDDNTLIYGTISQGFRSGGVNVFAHAQLLGPALGVGDPITIQPGFESDSLWNYELGYKSEWLDGRMILNGAVYYQDWSDIQVAEVSNGAFVIANGGDAHSAGIEAELTMLVTENLEVSFGGAVVEAKFDDDLPTGAFEDGDWLPDVPRYNASFAATYNFVVTDNLDGYVRGDYTAVGKSDFIRTALDGENQADSYDNINLRVGVTSDSWYATAFVDNVGDNRTELSAEFSRGGYYLNKPRTFGLTVGMNF